MIKVFFGFFLFLFLSINIIPHLINNNNNSNKEIDSFINSMTTREKIAQLMISNTFGEVYDDNSTELQKLKELCTKQKIGGFIFFKGTARGYANLSNKLQSYSKIPLLLSADFERGTKMRVTDGSLFPYNMAIGATNNPELSYLMGKLIAKESRVLGIHQNYAPVCDVNNNPNNPIINVRSFGEDPFMVSRMSEMMIKGLQDGNVIATAKHFPGHGDTEIDSHNDLPVLTFDIERLNRIELVPFKNAIDNGVKSVMVAHLSFPQLEPDKNLASSLSKNIVEGLLIDNLGFNGLIVTDALNMKGITKYYSTEEVAVLCVKAGIDLILMPADVEISINAIENAIERKEITIERIDRSVKKILEAKKWLGLYENKYVSEADVYKQVNTDEALQLGQRIADESITLVKDDKNIYPLDIKSNNLAVINVFDEKDNPNDEYMNNKIKELNSKFEKIDLISDLKESDINKVIESLSDNDIILFNMYAKVKFGTGKINILNSHVSLLNRLLSSNKKVAVISLGNPYLLKYLGNADNYICTYSDSEVSINALLKCITGEIKFKGKLPVSINEIIPAGTGIEK